MKHDIMISTVNHFFKSGPDTLYEATCQCGWSSGELDDFDDAEHAGAIHMDEHADQDRSA